MRTNDFFDVIVEGYLFHDLENMINLNIMPGEKYGNLGYPIIVSCISGMELLSLVLQQSPLPTDYYNSQHNYLNYYIENYLGQIQPNYKQNKLPIIIKRLLRNGIAHMFISKPDVIVVKSQKDVHLKKDDVHDVIYIDCIELVKDFKTSYETLVKQIIDAPKSGDLTNTVQIQSRIDELTNYLANETNSVLDLSQFIKVLSGTKISNASGMSQQVSNIEIFKK